MASKNSDLHQSKEKIDRSKRKLAQAGGLAVPAILTLANRPAWGADSCTPSGFESATAPGAIASQAVPSKNTAWKTPSQWRTVTPSTGNTIACGVAFLTQNGSNYKQITGFTLWTPATSAKTQSDIRANYTQKIFIDQLLGGTASAVTIYDALGLATTGTAAQQLTAYKLCNNLNNCVAPLPDAILTSSDLSFIKAFYESCVP